MFNFEGGCYAKVIRLSAEGEPEIYAATQMFGTVLENVVLDPMSRTVEFDGQAITENTRACYPIDYIPNHVPSGRGGHPRNVMFLTADAFGVLPPIARLTPEQAMYYFLSGYTAKVAGTERGVTEPRRRSPPASARPFLARHPAKYAEMLGEKLATHGASVWLVNTGWTGGAYGVGTRMKLAHTRAMVRAALAGALDGADVKTDPVFGFQVPTSGPRRAGRRARPARDLEGRRGVRRAGQEAGRRCSARTSHATPRRSPPPSGTPDRWSERGYPQRKRRVRGRSRSALEQHPARAAGTVCSTRRRSSGCATCGSWASPSWSIPAPPTPASNTPSARTTSRAARWPASRERGALDGVPEEDRTAARLAALLHDIGHYPFSHALEESGFPHHEALGVAKLNRGELGERAARRSASPAWRNGSAR